MTKNFAEQLILYQSNILPLLLEKLSQQLHVSVRALKALEIGYVLHNNCWAFPERDEYGDITGLSLRQWNNKKYMLSGSKRGLTYVPNIHRSAVSPDKYHAGPQNWVRVSEDIPCPICGKPDWCMVSAENPHDPKAVLCGRIKEGADRNLGTAGYLHIRKIEGNLSQVGSVLVPSEHPILIVEGATDVAAALDIDLVAVGRPSNIGRLDKLTTLIAGYDVIVLGENDAGAGVEGMEKTFEVLQPHAKRITKLLPPEGVKDLRQWVIQGVTQKQLLHLARTTGNSVPKKTILPSIAPLDLAKQWLEATYYSDDIFTLRVFHGNWYAYTEQCYKEIDKATIRQQLYRFFGDKQYKKIHTTGFNILNYEPTKHKLDEIMDALIAFCPITAEEIPCWLNKKHNTSDPKHILVFPNGYLDISSYIQRDEDFKLQQSSPHFFSLARYPYEFSPNATCVLWQKFLREIFADDPLKIALLQEWFGYNLIPDNSQEKFMMFLGPTRAGKGTILDVLAYILGEDDAIMIERKGKDITQTCIRLYTRFTMAANVMPQLPDFARTIESRMLVIQFLTSFIGREDITLKTRLKMEAPGILLWALKGLQRLQKNRNFTLPVGHTRILRRVRGEITPFTEFISDYCSLGEGPDYYILSEHLYECWKQWAIKNGERSQTMRWMNRSLLSLFPKSTGSYEKYGNR